jgi:lipopolysaccharide/colanic/teichoic acid biosynthesis glycosyltransferase
MNFSKSADSVGTDLLRRTRPTVRLAVKRGLDVLLALTASIALLPIALVIAIAIRLESRGPILYTQQRVGLDRRRHPGLRPHGGPRRVRTGYGRPFTMYKFRSMVCDAETGTGPVWAAERDPRVTRLGALLRRTHLDELPQFINVLRGEMSIVGPRPERPEMYLRLVAEVPQYAMRTRAMPGITGLAQLKNGYDSSAASAAKKAEVDLHYIRNASMLLDLKIMSATLPHLLQGKGDARLSKSETSAEVFVD